MSLFVGYAWRHAFGTPLSKGFSQQVDVTLSVAALFIAFVSLKTLFLPYLLSPLIALAFRTKG